MTARSPVAFLLSAALHALVAGLAILLSFSASRQDTSQAKVFELVAGEGDNFLATEAPALGTPGVKIDIRTPAAPKVEPTPVTPVPPRPDPVPIQPAPVKATPPPVTKPAPTIPDFSKKIKRDIIVAESKTKKEIAKARAAEAKRLQAEEKKRQEEEKKRQEEENRRLSKEEFDRLNKAKSQPAPRGKTPPAPTKIAKIDAEGIAKGVIGGSTRNKTGGAGGKALVATEGNEMERYYAFFKARLKERFEPPPGLSDTLVAQVVVRINADGMLTNARIQRSSGSKEFDQAVLDAVRRTTMPARPDRKSDEIQFPFTLREKDEP